jgi:hypothetical protein
LTFSNTLSLIRVLTLGSRKDRWSYRSCREYLKRGCKAVQMIHTGAMVTTEQFTTNATHLTIIIILCTQMSQTQHKWTLNTSGRTKLFTSMFSNWLITTFLRGKTTMVILKTVCKTTNKLGYS